MDRGVPDPRTRTLDVRVVGIDTESDLAPIRIDETAQPTLSFDDSNKLRSRQCGIDGRGQRGYLSRQE